jgi:hypothetical protein
LYLVALVVVLVACGSPIPGNEPSKQAQASPAAPLSTSDVQRITASEAIALLDSGEAVLYDTRSAAAYDTLHAAGALPFPEADAVRRLGELPADKSLIFYCT